MYIIGIDIAKRKHEAAVIDEDGTVIIKSFSSTNDCSGYDRLLSLLRKAELPMNEGSFAMEATGHYRLALFTRLQKEGFPVQVINPVQTNFLRNFYIRKELARSSFGFEMAGDVFSTMVWLYAKHIIFLTEQIKEIDRKIVAIMDELNTPITTIVGIGPALGAYILSEIGDISRFSSAAKLAAYAGIDPTMRRSGEYNGIRNRMSKRGSPYLRHAIWMAASVAVLHDSALREFFRKKRAEGKPYMTSVGHACRKIVLIFLAAAFRDDLGALGDDKTLIFQ